MTEEKKDDVEAKEKSGVVENLEAVGQIVLGEVEKVGGILLADSTAQSEGEYNLEAGILHQEVNKSVHPLEDDENEDKET